MQQYLNQVTEAWLLCFFIFEKVQTFPILDDLYIDGNHHVFQNAGGLQSPDVVTVDTKPGKIVSCYAAYNELIYFGLP